MSDPGRQPQSPPLAAGVEPCAQCGAPLAPDQRYCLNCGRRRGEPRLDYRRQSPTAAQNGQVPVESAAPTEERKQRDYAPLAAAGGIAVLGLMLLVGVLIGRGSGEDSPPTQPTQVVVPATEGSGSSSGGEKEAGALETKANPSKKRAKNGEQAAKNVAPPAAITASKDELQALEEKGGEGNYSEESAKLPDEIATPGKAPPEDNKAPGGGSQGTTIE